MAEDKYKEYIKKNPKFIEGGELDPDGFYNQPDGSKICIFSWIGFFDTEGFYFDINGYDEFGGYYDDEGNYMEVDFEGDEDYNDPSQEQEYAKIEEQRIIEETLALIDSSASNTMFSSILKNLPYRAKDENITEELSKLNIKYQDFIPTRDKATNKLLKVKLTTNDKESAKDIMKLHGQKFLGRALKVEFPDLDIGAGEEDEDFVMEKHFIDNEVVLQEITRPIQEEEKKKEEPVQAKKEEPKVQPEAVKPTEELKPKQKIAEPKDTRDPQASKPATEKGPETGKKESEIKKEVAKPKKKVEQPVQEISSNVASVWDLSVDKQQSMIKPDLSSSTKKTTTTAKVNYPKQKKKK